MSNRIRVVFSTHIDLVVEEAWSDNCSIEQVTKQAEDTARRKLEKLRESIRAQGGLLSPKPKLVRVIIEPGEE